MNKREAKWQTIFNQYLRKLQPVGLGFGHYELKQTITDKFFYSKIETTQYESLPVLESTGLVWKHSDQDQRIKPCDCSSIPPLPTYVVIKYPIGFCVIRYKDLMKEKEGSKMKSISQERAQQIAEKVIHF